MILAQSTITVHAAGVFIGIAILVSIAGTIYWMLHPPVSATDIRAKQAESAVAQMVGSIIVVYSDDIHSEHMMVLAARLAKRDRAELLAVYVIEVPLILPENAQMPEEDRRAFDSLAMAEVIAQHSGIHLRTEVLHARQTSQAVLDLAKREAANLIVMGSYREGKYTGAPLGRAIETIAAHARCDVLIGVPGPYGKMLQAQDAFTPATLQRGSIT